VANFATEKDRLYYGYPYGGGGRTEPRRSRALRITR
jgi:hypothetical protein